MSKYRSKTSGIVARAARAAEDPVEMTADARMTRLIKYAAEIIRENPDLTDLQVANAARLRMKADMTVLARKSAEARKNKSGPGGA